MAANIHSAGAAQPAATPASPTSARARCRLAAQIALVCSLVAVVTMGVALWSLSAALTPTKADLDRVVSERLDGPGPIRHELARADGPVVQTIVSEVQARQTQYLEERRPAIAMACGLTALVGASLASLAGWFSALALAKPGARRPHSGPA